MKPETTLRNQPISFLQFCELCEAIDSAKKIDDKKIKLNDFMKRLTMTTAVENRWFHVFQLLRLLIPHADRERPAYRIKYATLIKLLSKAFNLNTSFESIDTKISDYSSIEMLIKEISQKNILKHQTISLSDVDKFFNEITNKKNIEDNLIKFIRNLNEIELKWFIRILLKNLKINFQLRDILNAIHPKAFNIYQSNSMLSKVCQSIYDTHDYDSSKVQIFCPVQPQLCEKINMNKIDEILISSSFYLETKLDGERQQLHKMQNNYAYFSRRGHPYNVFGENPLTGYLTPRIHKCFATSVRSCILDGEMMLWNRNENRFISKGEGVNFLNITLTENQQICYCVFDILFLDGKSLISLAYDERIRILKNVLHDSAGNIVKIVSKEIKGKAEVLNYLNKAINNQEEGIIIKQKHEKYYPGQRGCGWYKIKPDYVDGMITDLDLVVLGVLTQTNKSKISSVIAGLKQEDNTYIALTVISSGLSNQVLDDLYESLSSIWKTPSVVIKNGRKIANVPDIDFGMIIPDYYIPPESSLLILVKSTELQKTNIFSTVYTLRFPRVICIRKDKSVLDAFSYKEFSKLFQTDLSRKIVKIAKNIYQPTEPKLLQESVSDKNDNRCKYQNIDSINAVDICIINFDNTSQPFLENKIKSQGGRIVATPGKSTFLCVAVNETEIVKKISKSRSSTIVHRDWALQAFTKEHLNHQQLKLVMVPFQMYCISKKDEEMLRQTSDQNLIPYNNINFYEKVSLTLNIHRAIIDFNVYCSVKNFDSSTTIYNNYNVFRGIRCFFKDFDFKNAKYIKAKMIFISRGGIDTTLNNCNLVITDDLEESVNSFEPTVHYLHYSWIFKMIE